MLNLGRQTIFKKFKLKQFEERVGSEDVEIVNDYVKFGCNGKRREG